MCTVCSMTQTFDPSRHEDGEEAFQLDTSSLTSSEISGATGISVGGTQNGFISSGGGQDFYAVTLEAGKVYKIDALGSDSGGGTLDDTDLHLYDATGAFIEYDDGDYSGVSGNWDASITFTATTTGTYYLMVDSYFSSRTGSYELGIAETIAVPPSGVVGTIDELALFLQEGTQGFSRSFDTSASNQITVNLNGLTADGQQLARWAMEAWEMVADLDFVEVNSGEMITLDDEDSGAFAYYPNSGSTSIAGGDNTNGVELNVSKSWLTTYGTSIDSYSFQTYIHEFGHALGLRHQGDYNGSADFPTDAYFTNDSWQLSVMSYFNQSENTTVDASYAFVTGAQMADIVAIQALYGAADASSPTAGDTTWGRGSNFGNYLDDMFDGIATGNSTDDFEGSLTTFTIYDYDGIDRIDLGFFGTFDSLRIDLNDGAFSDLGTGRIGVLGIAVDTMIEEVETGAGNDTITGNELGNWIAAGNGNDSIMGEDGADEILSGGGNDTTHGGIGNDTLYGGAGSDWMTGGSGMNELYGGSGSDDLDGGDDADVLGGGSGNDTLEGAGGNDTLWGSSGNDSIMGELGDDFVGAGGNKDSIYGGSGDDTIYGGGGIDEVYGGDDNDLLGGGAGEDTIRGEDGNDTLQGQGGNDTLFGGIGDDDISGGGQGDLLFGEVGNDTLNGGFGNDTLDGGADDDTLNGNFGRDVLTGGIGADTFVFDEGGQKTVTDFNLAQSDRLALDDALWGGGLTAAEVIDQFADDSSGTVVIAVGGVTITLQGVGTTTGLEGALDIF